jgi:hypothetical protein
LRAAGDTAAQVVLMLPQDSQRVMADILPRLPERLGGISGKQLADGLQWAALGVQLPPQLAARLTIQSTTAETAQATKEFLTGAVGLLVHRAGLHEKIPQIDQLLGLINPQVVDNRLVVELSEDRGRVTSARQILRHYLQAAREKAVRAQTTNQLKQLALALANFESAYGSLPPSASYDRTGKPLLSWRVFMLPFLEQKELYDQFRLDQPWDSEHNRPLIAKLPYPFAPRSSELREQGKTTFLVPVGEGTIYWGKTGTSLREITDGTSKTISIVEVAPQHAVIWTKPDDWQVDLQDLWKGLPGDRDSFVAAFADGSVRTIPKAIPTETLRRLLIRNDGKLTEDF